MNTWKHNFVLFPKTSPTIVKVKVKFSYSKEVNGVGRSVHPQGKNMLYPLDSLDKAGLGTGDEQNLLNLPGIDP
jgi:hypothetical protein